MKSMRARTNSSAVLSRTVKAPSIGSRAKNTLRKGFENIANFCSKVVKTLQKNPYRKFILYSLAAAVITLALVLPGILPAVFLVIIILPRIFSSRDDNNPAKDKEIMEGLATVVGVGSGMAAAETGALKAVTGCLGGQVTPPKSAASAKEATTAKMEEILEIVATNQKRQTDLMEKILPQEHQQNNSQPEAERISCV